MKERIRTKAFELRFDDCRFTTADAPGSAKHLARWLEAERHGEMAYLARNADKRADPQRVLPGARSVVCVARNYDPGPMQGAECRVQNTGTETPSPPHEPPAVGRVVPLGRPVGGARRPYQVQGFKARTSASGNPPHHPPSAIFHLPSSISPPPPSERPPVSGLVARYARHKDYHDVMGADLRDLAEFVIGLGGGSARALWYVDTGPVLERDFAQRAGLGFVGKHTNLISRRFGNWILLGEILTTLELEPDQPETNRCGNCTRCLAACPTQAITAPFDLDARRCISYLTIELKGPIPEALRPAIGRRIFGCDDCLEVCPWNRFASEARHMKQHRLASLDTPDLVELLSLDPVAFKQRFAGTPIERSKRRGLLRNVCVALGNTGDATVLPALEKASLDPDPLIAEHATWAIRQIRQRTGEPG